MPLTDTAIRNAKPREKPYKLSDERGMYLLVRESGKYFRFDYRFLKKRKTLALGVYPDVPLADARAKREDARKLIAKGIDPSVQKKKEKAKKDEMSNNTFEIIARKWFRKMSNVWSEKHAEKVIGRLELNIFPFIGNRPIKLITAPELLEVLRKIEVRGAFETAHRVKGICGQVFRYAIAEGKAERDPSQDLKGALTPVKVTNMAAITEPKKIGALLRAIDDYDGQFVTLCAFQLAPLVFVRPGELRTGGDGSEVDLKNAVWKIPAEKMKMKSPHIVPLSSQAINVFERTQACHRGWTIMSFHPCEADRPMSKQYRKCMLYGAWDIPRMK